jgi:hypothetical protein
LPKDDRAARLIWRRTNGRKRAIERFLAVVGDKTLGEVSIDDAIDYTE